MGFLSVRFSGRSSVFESTCGLEVFFSKCFYRGGGLVTGGVSI